MIGFMKKLPNILTSFRVVLALCLNYYIAKYFGSVLIPIIISLIIFLTDYFDGKIARICGLELKFGAIFDVGADLFYIVISYIILYNFDILPLWFLFVILFKFVEFIVTSNFIKKSSGYKSVFIFDFLGRFVAVIFYIIPLVTYMAYNLSQTLYLYIINLFLYIITFIVVIASSYRIGICINAIDRGSKLVSEE